MEKAGTALNGRGGGIGGDFIDSTPTRLRTRLGNLFLWQMSVFVVVHTEDRLGTAQHMAGRFGLTPEQLLSCTHMLIGTTEQMVEELLQRREQYGMSSITVIEAGIEAFAPVIARLAGK